MNNNLRLIINNTQKKIEEKHFFEKIIANNLRSLRKDGF